LVPSEGLDPHIIEERARFENALARIGFSPDERQGFIEVNGCRNVAMLDLLSPEQINCTFKRLSTRPINPLATSANQEQLVLAVRFWVASQQHLQLTFDADQVTAAMALNRAQIMQ